MALCRLKLTSDQARCDQDTYVCMYVCMYACMKYMLLRVTNSTNSHANCVLRIHRPSGRITCRSLLLHVAHVCVKNNKFSCTLHASNSPSVRGCLLWNCANLGANCDTGSVETESFPMNRCKRATCSMLLWEVNHPVHLCDCTRSRRFSAHLYWSPSGYGYWLEECRIWPWE